MFELKNVAYSDENVIDFGRSILSEKKRFHTNTYKCRSRIVDLQSEFKNRT